ncbi:DUF3703 domain-containing protein [Pseudoalteromonas sp. T1lg76]|uniref:DUF3703 domain-containing protein n=1 Tax=Pseudoalteromonas sp. T1lg76 TaxID=2077103 RepID=UPI000CF60605|nr:DUF3703 domain-containing protein [Pseudoalteromonas sp. T1lg76]
MNFTQAIRYAVLRELVMARRARLSTQRTQEFKHLENAHVLGQESTYWHTYTHWLMLVWGWKNKAYSEVVGQILRIVGAISKTAIGLLPTGNTGGANVSPFKPMSLSSECAQAIAQAKSRCAKG